jgi:hypothetical protein
MFAQCGLSLMFAQCGLSFMFSIALQPSSLQLELDQYFMKLSAV